MNDWWLWHNTLIISLYRTILLIWFLTIKISLRAFGILHEWFIIILSLPFYLVILLTIANVNWQFHDQVVSFHGSTMVNKLTGQDKKITNWYQIVIKACFVWSRKNAQKQRNDTHAPHVLHVKKCLIKAKIPQEFISSFAQFHNL